MLGNAPPLELPPDLIELLESGDVEQAVRELRRRGFGFGESIRAVWRHSGLDLTASTVVVGTSAAWRDGPAAHAFPVSVKGVCLLDGRVLLLRNEREEWELPGGKLEVGEEPAACVQREVREETGWLVTAGPVIDAWHYHIRPGVGVLILAYGCVVEHAPPVTISSEHAAAGLFTPDELDALPMPDGYRRSIRRWLTSTADRGRGVPPPPGGR